jgi:hypothetical protein
MLFKIALTIVLVWFLAGLIGLVVRSDKMRRKALAGLTVISMAMLTYYLLV